MKLVQHEARSGSLAPVRQGRPPGSAKLAPFEDFLIAEVEAEPDITMPELAGRLVFIDETSVNTKMTRPRGRSLKGQRLKAKAPFGHWGTQTFIAARAAMA